MTCRGAAAGAGGECRPDLATSAAVVGAPAIAAINHLVVTRAAMPEEARPGPAIRTLNLAGIAIMSALAIAYYVLRATGFSAQQEQEAWPTFSPLSAGKA